MSFLWVDVIVQVAERWKNPEYTVREKAVKAELAADNVFTEESLAFAVNQLMNALTGQALKRWAGEGSAETARRVGVVHAGDVPLSGFRDFLAVLLTGHHYYGYLPAAAPALLLAFAEDLQEVAPELPVTFADKVPGLLAQVEAVIAQPSENWPSSRLVEVAQEAQISEDRQMVRHKQFAVAIVDGQEEEEARSGLAEDMLVYEGEGAYSVGLIWAPQEQNPDPYLHTLAQFREVFPPHKSTNGALAMPRAFLEASDQSHAWGNGFLISRGAPEAQRSAHIRWTEYNELKAAAEYLQAHADEISLVVAEDRLAPQLQVGLPVAAPGNAHRRPLEEEPSATDVVKWLRAL